MASVVLLARYWMVVVSVVVVVVFLAPFGSSSEILWSEDSLNGCCGKCNTPNQCKTTPALEKTPIKCSFVQYDKTQINPSTSIRTSCGKPDKLRLYLAFGNDTVLNVTWKFPRDETIAKVTGFLVTVQYENPSVSGEIVNLFKVNGTLDLPEEELMKLADDVEFVYDCLKVMPNTTYTVTVQALPSIKEAALERATLRTNDTGEKVVANCNSRWVAWMYVNFVNSATKVCFKTAPEALKINKYVLHVMPRSQYDGPDPRTPENMEKIDLTGRGLSGTTICRNFTLKEKKEYVAMLQPDEFCTCFNNDEVCQHTFVNFIVPAAASTITLSAVPFPSTSAVVIGGGIPTWHVALIAFFISLIVVTGVILLALYCFINGFKDFLRSLLFHFFPTSDKTVLLVFQPACDASTTEAIGNFVCHLKWKSRAAIETVPELDPRGGRCAGFGGGGECIKSKPDEPSVVCQCFCCKMDVSHTTDVVSKVKVEILRYDRIILFHSRESSRNYQVFQKTDDVPVRTCSAFVRVASLYDCKAKPADKERESVNQPIIGDDYEQMEPAGCNPEPVEAVPKNPVGLPQLRSDISETSLGLSGRIESGYYSCFMDEDKVAEEMDNMEAQGKDTKVEYKGKDTEVEYQGMDTKVEYQGKDTKVEYQGMDTKVEYQGKDTKVEYQGMDTKVEYQGMDTKVEYQGKDTKVEYQGMDTKVEYPGMDTKVEYQGKDTKVEYQGIDTKVEYQGMDTKVEYQEDKLEPLQLFPHGEPFERSSAIGTSSRSSLDRSFCFYGQSLPPVLHVRLGSDEGVDTDLLKSSFKSPEVFDAAKDFSEIVNKIIDNSIHIFESPSVVSEI